jgi:predicted esterase
MNIISKKITLPISLHYDLKIPEEKTPMPLLIALHGYGENKEKSMDLMTEHLKEPCIIASLQAPFPHMVRPVLPGKPIKYAFGWITSFNPEEAIGLHHEAINQIIVEVSQNSNIKISKIILLGFSQSVGLNFRYVFSNPNTIDGVIAICGGLPGDWGKERKYASSQTDILYIGCKKDLIYPAPKIRDNAEKLKPKCRSIEVHIYDTKHEIPKESFDEIRQFIAKVL